MIDIMVPRQSYKEKEIDEIRWICGKNNPANVMIETSPNLTLEKVITTNKAIMRLKEWVKR